MKKQFSLLRNVAFATMMIFTFVQCEEGVMNSDPVNPNAKTDKQLLK